MISFGLHEWMYESFYFTDFVQISMKSATWKLIKCELRENPWDIISIYEGFNVSLSKMFFYLNLLFYIM